VKMEVEREKGTVRYLRGNQYGSYRTAGWLRSHQSSSQIRAVLSRPAA
jgi:hypothetical protein